MLNHSSQKYSETCFFPEVISVEEGRPRKNCMLPAEVLCLLLLFQDLTSYLKV